jgi:hypothetical protein
MHLNNAVLLALLAGFVAGVFGADSIGLWLVRIGTLIRRRGK